VSAVFLNSPFLDMNLPAWQAQLLEPLVAGLGRWFPRLVIPVVTTVYAQSLLADHHGEWRYNTEWKPIAGFPIFAGWFRSIHRAHAEVARGLSIQCPVLVMFAQRSSWPKQWTADAMRTDVVLDVADIARLAPKLGPRVTLVGIEDGMHDLVLSQPLVRARVFAGLKAWLVAVGGAR
jgi:alpha-beta hydrolase superfamily lysophospholipase